MNKSDVETGKKSQKWTLLLYLKLVEKKMPCVLSNNFKSVNILITEEHQGKKIEDESAKEIL